MPWISKVRLAEMNQRFETALTFAQQRIDDITQSSTKQVEAAEKIAAHWQIAYDKERARVERMQDNFLQMNGAPPVSERGLKVIEKHEKHVKDIGDQMKELFLEQSGEYQYSPEEREELTKMGLIQPSTVAE